MVFRRESGSDALQYDRFPNIGRLLDFEGQGVLSLRIQVVIFVIAGIIGRFTRPSHSTAA